MHDTLYIAEPIFSQKLQQFDPEATFPPIKKIGFTSGHPSRREKELLGTISPIKMAIRKAWTGIDAREVEKMLHQLLDNCRLDGEYFWDGHESLLASVTAFMARYYPDAELVVGQDDPDVRAAETSANEAKALRIARHLIPALDKLGIEYQTAKNGTSVLAHINDYTLRIRARSGDRYSLFVFSRKHSARKALSDFPGTEPPAFRSETDPDEKWKKAVLSMRELPEIIDCIAIQAGK